MFSLIREQQESHAVARLCRVLEVNRSSYRYWSGRLKKVPVHRLKLIAKLKRWFDLKFRLCRAAYAGVIAGHL